MAMNGCLQQTLQSINKITRRNKRGPFLYNKNIIIDYRDVSKIYAQDEEPSVKNISLSIQQGESLILIGSSGSGKTTLLKMLNGLEKPTSGTIYIKEKNINDYNMKKLRRTFFSYVFQKIGLFPHMTIEKNIELVLRINRIPQETWTKKIEDLLKLMHLDPLTYLNRYPDQLSGGEQQRIGVARALATDSECMLMDEPFGALDAVTRCELQDEILNLKKELKKTIIFVTHDISEAFKLGDRIAVMQKGKLEQVGTKEDLIHSPKTPFVEQLVQAANIGQHFV